MVARSVQSDPNLEAGNAAEFDDDWRRVLATGDMRYIVFPMYASERQVNFLEWIKAQQIIALLHSNGLHSGQVLEYGCGAAGISLYLAQQGYRAHVCDLSAAALDIAELNRVTHAPDTHLATATVANGMELPYHDHTFDVVMSYGLLEHFEPASLRRLLDETLRVLRPGGLFLADIVPGPGRLSARTVGMVVSYLASLAVRTVLLQWQTVPTLYGQYFGHYETTYNDKDWYTFLSRPELHDLHIQVCRPFPLLSLTGWPERLYTDMLRLALPLHQAFDGHNSWWMRRWGWMYLASGRKVEHNT
jgi:SAM-dependent methyltransferase